ncbi:MAG: PEP-CTERM sorting domain-containing protein [Phycisphaerae bacterium]
MKSASAIVVCLCACALAAGPVWGEMLDFEDLTATSPGQDMPNPYHGLDFSMWQQLPRGTTTYDSYLDGDYGVARRSYDPHNIIAAEGFYFEGSDVLALVGGQRTRVSVTGTLEGEVQFSSTTDFTAHGRRTEFTTYGNKLIDTLSFHAWDPDTSYMASMALDNFQFRVPEPLTLGMMLAGGLVCVGRRSRKI